MKLNKFTYSGGFDFEAGGHLEQIDIVYHSSSREYRQGDKVVWICHALTANSDAEDWWPEMVGEGKIFDTEKYFVVCANIPGSPYGTTGPASVNPKTGKPYFFDFPAITTRDIVAVNELVRKHIGIEKVDLLVGSSIGGFYALEWAVMHPDVIAKAVFMATSARVTPYLTAFEESQRMALEADPSFREAASLDGGQAGLRCARSIALISYRSYDGYNLTQHESDEDTLFASRSASYQQYQGKKLSGRFDAYSYWYIANEVDSHNLGRGRGGVAKALSRIKCDSTVVAIEGDCIFPPKEVKIIADGIEGSKFHIISSDFGHDGFLLETEQLTQIIEPLLK